MIQATCTLKSPPSTSDPLPRQPQRPIPRRALVIQPLIQVVSTRLDDDFADAVGARVDDHGAQSTRVASHVHQSRKRQWATGKPAASRTTDGESEPSSTGRDLIFFNNEKKLPDRCLAAFELAAIASIKCWR